MSCNGNDYPCQCANCSRDCVPKRDYDTAHARIAELEAVLRDWIQSWDGDNGPNILEHECYDRAKALLEGK